MPCAYLLSILLVPLSFSVSNGSFFSTGCRFYSSSYLCLFGFVPVLRLPGLTLRCLAVESSRCVSSSDFVLGGSSSFILLCFVSFILNFLRGFTSSFHFWYSSSSWAFARSASLSYVLAAASCSSTTVFTSFYLSNVQFSSSPGFSLGPVVAAGSVV